MPLQQIFHTDHQIRDKSNRSGYVLQIPRYSPPLRIFTSNCLLISFETRRVRNTVHSTTYYLPDLQKGKSFTFRRSLKSTSSEFKIPHAHQSMATSSLASQIIAHIAESGTSSRSLQQLNFFIVELGALISRPMQSTILKLWQLPFFV
jgi:hypothetical protein